MSAYRVHDEGINDGRRWEFGLGRCLRQIMTRRVVISSTTPKSTKASPSSLAASPQASVTRSVRHGFIIKLAVQNALPDLTRSNSIGRLKNLAPNCANPNGGRQPWNEVGCRRCEFSIDVS